jgi:glyoxylase-like metal-dependent hydrolase (beta-lactamase superfamily II)
MATELADGVWQFQLRGVNAYLIEDDALTLVDAGTPFDESAIREGVADAGFAVGDVERVLLTHYDLDHVGALAELEPDLDAPVYAGEFAADVLEGRRSPPLTNHKGAFQRAVGRLVTRPSLDVRVLGDGDRVGTFTAYHTPGHTPGHLAFVSGEFGVGLLGDLVAASGGELEPSGWLMSYDTDAVRESVASLAERAPAFEVACVGHGTPLTAGGSDALRSLADARRTKSR